MHWENNVYHVFDKFFGFGEQVSTTEFWHYIFRQGAQS